MFNFTLAIVNLWAFLITVPTGTQEELLFIAGTFTLTGGTGVLCALMYEATKRQGK